MFVILLDRLTKQIVVSAMHLHQSIPFIGDVVRWTYIHNDGMIFGLNIPGGKTLGILSLIGVMVVLIVLLKMEKESASVRWILAGILGGAIGNTYDRVAFGYVVDFIDVDLPDFLMDRWPIFNVADSFLSVGVIILIIVLLVNEKKLAKSQSSEPDLSIASEDKEQEESAVNVELENVSEGSNDEES